MEFSVFYVAQICTATSFWISAIALHVTISGKPLTWQMLSDNAVLHFGAPDLGKIRRVYETNLGATFQIFGCYLGKLSLSKKPRISMTDADSSRSASRYARLV